MGKDSKGNVFLYLTESELNFVDCLPDSSYMYFAGVIVAITAVMIAVGEGEGSRTFLTVPVSLWNLEVVDAVVAVATGKMGS
jgi:hypothetical protein